MTGQQMVTLLPLLVLAATPVVVMLVAAFHRSHGLTLILTLVGLAATLAALPVSALSGARQVTSLLVLDDYALLYIGLLAAVGLIVTLISYGYLKGRDVYIQEYYILVLLATLGGAVLVASSHFASLFLGLELLSVALYTLVAYPRLKAGGIEAGIKYLVLASTTVAFLLFGMAIIYGELGTMELARIAKPSVESGTIHSGLLAIGLLMVLIGIGFKLAVVPFHMWVADVFEGAPAPVTGFLAATSKGAMFALLLRYTSLIGLRSYPPLFVALAISAFASMLVGNLLALQQQNIKRILAYSSVAHFGYLLVALLAGGTLAGVAITFYLVAYFITTLLAFGIITVLSGAEGDAEDLDVYRGLAARRPWLAGMLTVALFSLAGIPLTVGFVGKFYLVAAGASAALWALIITLVLTSVIGLYYYLRVIVALYSSPPQGEALTPRPRPATWMAGLALAALFILLLWLGTYPAPLIRLIKQVVGATLAS